MSAPSAVEPVAGSLAIAVKSLPRDESRSTASSAAHPATRIGRLRHGGPRSPRALGLPVSGSVTAPSCTGGATKDADAHVPAPTLPDSLLDETAHPAGSDIERCALDVFWAIEDLLLRACATHGVVVEGSEDDRQIRLLGVLRPGSRLDGGVLRALLDPQTYRWRMDGSGGSFVSLIRQSENDLLLQLAPSAVVHRWADGSLTWPMQALLRRLHERAACVSSDTNLVEGRESGACNAGRRHSGGPDPPA